MVTLANLNPFDSALVSEMRAGSATAPNFTDPPVAVAVNSSSCGGTESRSADNDSRSMKRDGLSSGSEIEPSRDVARGSAKRDASCGGYGAGLASGPQDSNSVSAISAEGVVPAGEIAPPNPPLVGTSNPELAQVSRADVAPRRGTPLSTPSLGTGGKTDQASFTPIGPRSLPTGPTPAADALTGSAALSLDLRIHNIMLAVADELADEQRTINERLLLRQFAPQLRHT